MSRRNNIRWRKSDQIELEKAVRNYNAKLNRLIKNNPEHTEKYPDRAYIKEIKSNVKTRSDLKKAINSLNRLGKNKNTEFITSEYGLTVTKYEKNEVALKVKLINQQRKRKKEQLENLDATLYGKPIGLKRGEMGSVRMNELKPKVFNFDKKRPSDWKAFVRSVNRMSSSSFQSEADEKLRENYIKGFLDVFGNNTETQRIAEMIRNNKNFITIYYQEQEATIDFIYDPMEIKKRLSIIEMIYGE